MQTCGRQYRYRYVDRLEPVTTSAARPVGRALHIAVTDYIKAHALGREEDPLPRFETAWAVETSGQTLTYPTNWDADSMYAASRRLVELFPDAWRSANLVAVLDPAGVPIVERGLVVPSSPDVELEVVIDVVVMALDSGAIGVLDLKSASTPHAPAFGANSLQLTTYQDAVDYAYARHLGPVQNVGFMELIKRKLSARGQGPSVNPPQWYPRRTDDDIREMRAVYAKEARNILERRFERPLVSSFNSPCSLCDYARLCVNNDLQGYRHRPPSTAMVA
jgi:hypothetical protein